LAGLFFAKVFFFVPAGFLAIAVFTFFAAGFSASFSLTALFLRRAVARSSMSQLSVPVAASFCSCEAIRSYDLLQQNPRTALA